MCRNPHEDFSEDEVDPRNPDIPQDRQGYKEMGKQENLQWSSSTRGQQEIDHRLLEDTLLVMHRHMKRHQLKTKTY
jgi:hypothetical protein